MQLHLEAEELNLLANVLLERVGSRSTEQGSSGPDRSVQQGPGFFDDLLDKVLARDLRLDADELEAVVDLLTKEKLKLTKGGALLKDAAPKAELQRKLRLLERVLEKVDEACAMV
jgi:hypothetical protein